MSGFDDDDVGNDEFNTSVCSSTNPCNPQRIWKLILKSMKSDSAKHEGLTVTDVWQYIRKYHHVPLKDNILFAVVKVALKKGTYLGILQCNGCNGRYSLASQTKRKSRSPVVQQVERKATPIKCRPTKITTAQQTVGKESTVVIDVATSPTKFISCKSVQTRRISQHRGTQTRVADLHRQKERTLGAPDTTTASSSKYGSRKSSVKRSVVSSTISKPRKKKSSSCDRKMKRIIPIKSVVPSAMRK